MNNRLVAISIAFLMAISMVAAFPQSARTHYSSAQSSNSQLVVGMTVAPDTTDFNPVKILITYYMAETYASLVGWDSQGNNVPMLAQNWTISPDGLNFTFHLRPNLVWSDGQPLNSSDVAFTFKLLAESAPLWFFLTAGLQMPNSSTLTGSSLRPGAITTPNATTVVFHLLSPSAVFFINAAGQPIYAEHYYASQNLTANNPDLSTMVGSGPFIPRSYTPGSELDMVANPHYLGGAPHLSGVVIKYFSDSTAAEIALESGSVNFLNGVPSTDVAALSKVSGLTIATQEDQSNIYVIYNMHAQLSDNSANPVSKIAVRKAIAMALDLPTILNASFGSSQYYKLANQIEVPNLYYLGHPAQNTTIPKPEYPYNATAAAQLLDGAGYPADTSGHRFDLSIVAPSGGIGSAGTGPTLKMLQLIQSELSAVGITLRITFDDTTTYNNDMYGAPPPKNWNLGVSVISESADPDVPQVYMLGSLNGNAGAGGFNAGGFNDSTFNQLVLLEENTTNPSQRIPIFQKMDGYIHEMLPVLELYYQIEVVAWTNNFQGFQLGLGNPWHDYWGALKSQSIDNVTMVGSTTTTSSSSSSTTLPATSSSSATSTGTASSSASSSSSSGTVSTSVPLTSTSTGAVSSTSSSTGGSSLSVPLIAGIIVVILVIVGVAAYALRRGRGAPPARPTPATP